MYVAYKHIADESLIALKPDTKLNVATITMPHAYNCFDNKIASHVGLDFL